MEIKNSVNIFISVYYLGVFITKVIYNFLTDFNL